MSSAARPVRSRRGRIMIVGDLPELTRFAPQLQQSPVVVRNIFDALGEITVCTAATPISAVLISERCLNDRKARAVEALRKIDPALRLVLVTNSSSNSNGTSNGSEHAAA